MKDILSGLSIEDTHADWYHFDAAPGIVADSLVPEGASDLDRHIHEGYAIPEDAPHPGEPGFMGHHDRMMRATDELRRKARWAKTKNSPAPKST